MPSARLSWNLKLSLVAELLKNSHRPRQLGRDGVPSLRACARSCARESAVAERHKASMQQKGSASAAAPKSTYKPGSS